MRELEGEEEEEEEERRGREEEEEWKRRDRARRRADRSQIAVRPKWGSLSNCSIKIKSSKRTSSPDRSVPELQAGQPRL